jgi:MtN3 and saliva related transmembrane protein
VILFAGAKLPFLAVTLPIIKEIFVLAVTLSPPSVKGKPMDMTQIIGLAAGTCTSLAAAPQLIKAWKTKEVKDLSLKMFLLFVVGIGLWLVYGVLKSDFPIIVTNSISLAINAAMLALKLKYKDKGAEDKQPELA